MILIGKLGKAFGLKGEMKCEPYTDFIEERFKKNSFVYLKKNDEVLKMTVLRTRTHKGQLLVTFKDYEDINLIESYRGYEVYKAKEDIAPLKKGEYYFSDLIGLDVYEEENKVGKVINMEEGLRYNFMRVLKDDEKEVLVPYLDVFVKEVILEEKKIILKKVEGLL